jgi:hypothetical protein
MSSLTLSGPMQLTKAAASSLVSCVRVSTCVECGLRAMSAYLVLEASEHLERIAVGGILLGRHDDIEVEV